MILTNCDPWMEKFIQIMFTIIGIELVLIIYLIDS